MAILVKTKKTKNEKTKTTKQQNIKQTHKHRFLNLLRKCLVGWMRPGEGWRSLEGPGVS